MSKLPPANCQLVIIGGSAGSLEALIHLFRQLRADFRIPVVVVMHRSAADDGMLVRLLSIKTSHQVQEAGEKETIDPGRIYIAPPGYHLLIEDDWSFALDYSEKINYSRPSIDVSFASAADAYRTGLVAILLSGANADGAQGLKAVSAAGGFTIVQDPATAQVPYMPAQAIALQQPALVLSPDDMANFLNQLSR